MTKSKSSQLELLVNSKNTTVTAREFHLKEKLKECFKLRYYARSVKNKGAILVIVWSFLVSSIYFYTTSMTYSSYMFDIMLTIVGLTLHITGWLADVRLYKFIHKSFWIMWFSLCCW